MAGRGALHGALADLLRGDHRALARRIEASPEVLHARFPSFDPPYDGYFHGATLLHHVAGNPLISPLPTTIVDAAQMMTDRGAVVDAVTLQGPSQPDDIGWTTLGLAATSAEARRRGIQLELMKVLVEAGADPNARQGGCLMGALYYGESVAAEMLVRLGARVDVVAAAGLGDVESLRNFLDSGQLKKGLAHYGRVAWPSDAGPADVLGLALIFAALHGRTEAIRLLVAAGADPDHRPPFDARATALHWAVVGDRPDAVRALLDAGADPTLTDDEHGATPLGWAERLGRDGPTLRCLTPGSTR